MLKNWAVRRKVAALNQTIHQLYQQGKYQQAVATAQGALGLAQIHLGAEHPNTAICLNNLGFLLKEMGDLGRARPSLEQALAIQQRVLAPRHAETAKSLNNLGLLLHAMGDLAGARSYLEQALSILPKGWGARRVHTATCLNNLGFLLQEMGDWSGARPYLEQSLSIMQRVLGLKHPNTATCLSNLGLLLDSMGDLAGAWSCHERALAIRQRALGPEHPDTAVSNNNLGTLLYSVGDLAGARPYYERALAIRQRVLGSEHPDTAASLSNLGALLDARGDLAEARSYYEQALAIRQRVLGPEHPDTATSFNNLGYLLEALGDLAGARSYHERALAVRQKVLGPEHPTTASSLHNFGSLLHSMGDLTGARPYLEQALAVRQRVLDPEHPSTANSLHSLASLYVALDRQADAMKLALQAAAIDDRMIGQVFSLGSESQRTAFIQTIRGNMKAFLSLVLQYFEQSAEAIRAALELVLRRKAIMTEALAIQRDAVLGGKYPALKGPLRRLADLRMQIAHKILAGPGPEGWQTHRQQLEQWHSEKERLEAVLSRQLPEMNLAAQLRQADRRAVALALPEGFSLIEFVRFEVFNFKAVLARGDQQWKPVRYLAFVLPAGEPDNVQMIDLGEAEPIDQLIADFRSGITGEAEHPGGGKMVKPHSEPVSAPREDAGRRLRAAVFDKLVPALGKHQRLLLAPDGDLARLPFEVLPAADARLLIDTYQISYVGCGRDVLRFGAKTTGQPAAPLVVADPDFDFGNTTAGQQQATEDASRLVSAQPKTGFWSRLFGRHKAAPPRRSQPAQPASSPRTPGETVGRPSRDLDRGKHHFGRLPGTRVEGERVAALLEVQPWLDTAALESRLKQHCRSPQILHLATHGFFLQDQPHDPNRERRDLGVVADLGSVGGRLSGPLPENPLLRSGLALAGANTWLQEKPLPPEAEDGLLTAEDVSGLDLLATELVVLSACETGLGEVKMGEGVFGLQRAFVLAGAKTLVMSLWSVPDEPTRELMEDFYRRILSGEPRGDALRAAQMMLRAKYPDPFYWGAFICQGNPGPLPQPTP